MTKMTKAKYHISEGGNIAVVALGNSLIIKVSGPGTYLVTNPSDPGVFFDVHNVDVFGDEPVEAIFKRIENQQKNRPLNSFLNSDPSQP